MTQTSRFLINHGLPLVFGAVFVERIGLPLPALPWLLAAGALSATGQFIVYCSCPNEVSSARVTLALQRRRYTRVRPLLGGIDAWRKNNYPTEIGTGAVTTTVSNVVVDLGPNSQNTTASKTLVGNADPASARSKESEHGAREQQA